MFQRSNLNKSPSYLIRNPHSYCFRMIAPKDLRDIIGRREFRYSLKTGSLSIAKSRARLLAGLIQPLFVQIRSNRSAFGRADVEASIRKFLGFVLESLETLPTMITGIEADTPAAGIKLERLVDEYVQENLRSNRWSQRTLKDYRTCFNLFLRYFRDVPLGSMNYKRMQEYKKLLIELPPNFMKKPESRKLSLAKVADLENENKLSAPLLAYLISIRTALEAPLLNLVREYTKPLNSSRHGVRILAMKTC